VSDLIDQATEREEELRQEALLRRKPVPDKCECGKPVHVLGNGARKCVGDLDAL
jgi:hypothetical protein